MKRQPAQPKAGAGQCSAFRTELSKQDQLCQQILLKAGRFCQSPDLFYHRLWRDRLQGIGFRVYYVERIDPQPVWDIRLTGSLTAQAYLLLSRPAKKWILAAPDVLENQLKAEVQQMAKEMGPPIKSNAIHVSRAGRYFRVSFIWAAGKPGVLLLPHKKPDAFTALIKPWLRQLRN